MQLTLMDVALLILLWCGNHAHQSGKKVSKNRLRKEKICLPIFQIYLEEEKKTDIGEPEMEQEEKFVLGD